MKKITASRVLTSRGIEKDIVITLDDTGKIVNIERGVENIDGVSHLEHYNGLIIPGMVNCHSHIEYSYVKGLIPRGSGLPEFIRSIIEIKIKNEVPDEKKADAAKVWDEKMFQQGVVAVGDHNNNDYVYDMKKGSKIYYHNFIELYDEDNQDADTTFHNGLKRAKESEQLGFTATVIPHACYTMEDRLIALTGGEATSCEGEKATGVLSTHFKESTALGGEDETSRVIDNISADRSSIIFVHSIYASREDMILAKNKFGDKLTISCCPLSNVFIEKTMGDIEMFRELGIRIAIGTDSLSSNDTLSMVDEMKSLSARYPNISMQEIIEMATINGAEALKIEQWAGTIEENKSPGIVLLENVDLVNMKFTENSTSRRIY